MYLPVAAAKDDFKTISDYFYVSGAVDYGADWKGGHAFIQSAATGNIIDTVGKDPRDHYCEVFDPDYGIENMRKGEKACTFAAVYGGINILTQ